MEIYIFAPVIALVINALMAELILLRFNFSKDLHVRAYVSLAISVAAWSFGQILTTIAQTESEALIGNSISSVAFITTAVSLLMFTAAFAKVEWLTKSILIRIGMSMAIAGFAILAASGLITEAMVRQPWGWWPMPGPIFLPLTITGISMAVMAVGIMLKQVILASTSRLRLQAAIVASSTIIPILIGSAADIGTRYIGMQTYPVTVFFATMTSIAIAFSMLRFRFLEITPELVANSIANSMVEYLVAVNEDDRIVFANPAAQKAVGKPWEQVQNKDISNYISSSGDLLSEDRLPTFGARAYLTKEDNYIPLSCNIMKFYSEALNGKILLMRDVSDTEKLIENLQEMTDELSLRESELERMNRQNVQRGKEILKIKKQISELKTRK
jgi:PAS domain-containing protein